MFSVNVWLMMNSGLSETTSDGHPHAHSGQDEAVTPRERTRLELNCSDFLSPPLAFGSTRLPNCS